MTEGHEPPEGWSQEPSPSPGQQPTQPAWRPPAGPLEGWEPTQQQPPPSVGWPPSGQPPSGERPPKDQMSRAERIGYIAGRIIAIPLMILVALGIAWGFGAIFRAVR